MWFSFHNWKSNFQIYTEIRDRHFSSVFPFLSSKAKELQAIHEVGFFPLALLYPWQLR